MGQNSVCKELNAINDNNKKEESKVSAKLILIKTEILYFCN